jgi:hypothetical protein
VRCQARPEVSSHGAHRRQLALIVRAATVGSYLASYINGWVASRRVTARFGQVICPTPVAAAVTAADFDVHLRIVMQIRQHAQGQSRPARRSSRHPRRRPGRPSGGGLSGRCCTSQLYS